MGNFQQKPDDLTLEECPEAFVKMNEGDFDLIMALAYQGVWHICEQIFGYLNYESVENCRKVSKLWNKSLERIALVKFIEEFGDRNVEEQKRWEEEKLDPENKVSTIFPGWQKAAKKYGVKVSLIILARRNGKCCSHLVHEAAENGFVKLIEFILRTSFDMNAKDKRGITAWHYACQNGRTETARLIIQSSKDFGIDLNAKSTIGRTAWDEACKYGQTEIVQLIIKNSKDFGIDLSAARAFHLACKYGQTEIVQLIIKNSKDFGIDLSDATAFHLACEYGQTETAKLIIQNSKHFGIDLNAKNNNYGALCRGAGTALHSACTHGKRETAQ